MAYNKTVWVNDSTPAINATNLNNIENGIETLDNTLNNMTESMMYSTNEVKTNSVWINGKPIYRKVFTFTTPSGDVDYVINTNISNIGTIISCTGGITETNGALTPIPIPIDFSGTIYTTSFRINDGNIYYKGHSAYGNKPAFAILEYTKTTD